MSAVEEVQALLSERSRLAGTTGGMSLAREGSVFFSGGFPDPARLPFEDIAAATARAMGSHGQWPLQYGPTFGFEGMLDFLVKKLAAGQGIQCTREHLLLTAGGSQALGLLCDLLLDPGDTILSEAPTWMGAVRTFANYGVEVESVPVDELGTDVDVLAAKLESLRQRGVRPKFLYVIPNFQNPLGLTTTIARRRRVVELAREYGFAILEDDAYFDLRFEGEKLPTLYELDGGERVLYFGTFSKIIAAGMRLGWIVGSPDLIARLGALKVDGSTSPFAAHVAYEYCQDGRLERRVDELISTYRQRRDQLLGELEERMPEDVSWTRPEGGFFVWLTLPEGVDARRMLPKARELGVDYSPGPIFFYDGGGERYMRLSFSYVTPEEMSRGVSILSDLIREESRSAS